MKMPQSPHPNPLLREERGQDSPALDRERARVIVRVR
jgi:hypothetical protein